MGYRISEGLQFVVRFGQFRIPLFQSPVQVSDILGSLPALADIMRHGGSSRHPALPVSDRGHRHGNINKFAVFSSSDSLFLLDTLASPELFQDCGQLIDTLGQQKH